MDIIYSNNEFRSENVTLGWMLSDLKTELKQEILNKISEILKAHQHNLNIKDVSVGHTIPNAKALYSYHHSVTAGVDDLNWRYLTLYVKWKNKMPCCKSIVKATEKILKGDMNY